MKTSTSASTAALARLRQRLTVLALGATGLGMAMAMTPATAHAQTPATTAASTPRWTFARRLGAGPGTTLGFEANPRGGQLQVAIDVTRSGGWLSLRPELRQFLMQEHPVSPCLIGDSASCFQTARREVTSVALAVEARLPVLRSGDSGPYVVAGVGAFHGRTRLRRYGSCAPDTLCTDDGDEYTYAETSPGLLLAVGATMQLGPVPAYWEAGWQRTRARQGTSFMSLERLTGYTLLPFSLGVRW